MRMATSTLATVGKATVAIDPVTRVEGHLKAEVVIEKGKVVDARLSGGMYRGFENILKGRDPRDATQLVQRLCGVCPTSHSTCSALAQDDAFTVKVTENARLTRNLILGANYLQSHILHFYHLAALDFVRGPDTAPFVPRFREPDLRLPENINSIGVDQYLEALEARRTAHEMTAMFGGRMPHIHGIVAGGTTEIPAREKLIEYGARFLKVKEFVEQKYLPVVYTVGSVYKDLFRQGQGYKNCISFGVFPMDASGGKTLLKSGVYINGRDSAFDPRLIKEYVKYSWFADSTTGLPYDKGRTTPAVDKKGAYSFVKAPRYNGRPVESGPLARMWITNPELSETGRKLLKDLFGIKAQKFRDIGEDAAFSLMGRHVARAEETLIVADAVAGWLKEVRPDEETWTSFEIPASGEGLGLTEAPRGSLLHYIRVAGKKIENYNIISATVWNSNPRDDKGQRGPIEEALIGVEVKDVENPVNVARLIRAFDP
jgi:hydrogenase large subunit